MLPAAPAGAGHAPTPPADQVVPKSLLPQLPPVVDHFLEDLLAVAAALLPEVVDAGFQAGEPRRPPGGGDRLPPLGRRIGVEVLQPHVAVVDVAQQRLHPLDGREDLVQRRAVDRLGDLDRVAQPLGGDPHGMVPAAVVHVLQAVLAAQHFLQPAQDVPPRLGAGEIAVVGRLQPLRLRTLPLGQHGLGHRLHLVQHLAGGQAVDRLDHRGLQQVALVLQLGQQPHDAGKTTLVGDRGKDAAEKIDLHVLVARRAQPLGDAADLLPPPLHRLGAEAIGKHLQRRPQTPRGDAGPVNELDVFRPAHPVQLLGKLLRLPANVMGGQETDNCDRETCSWLCAWRFRGEAARPTDAGNPRVATYYILGGKGFQEAAELASGQHHGWGVNRIIRFA